MTGDRTLSLDWWMHQIYRRTKDFITNPTKATEERLSALIAEYRAHHEGRQTPTIEDEHERVMDYR